MFAVVLNIFNYNNNNRTPATQLQFLKIKVNELHCFISKNSNIDLIHFKEDTKLFIV